MNNVKKELNEMLNYRMGMISENHEHLEPDQLNQEREKRSINHIIKEVKNKKFKYKILVD